MSHDVSVRGTGGGIFAGTLLIIGGAQWIAQGIAGIIKGTSYLENANYLDHHECRYLGMDPLDRRHHRPGSWLRRLFGAAWARLLGIIIATISIVVTFTFIPLAPWWALTIILIGLWIIHSLFVHRRLRD
jgi:hypothetical protein